MKSSADTAKAQTTPRPMPYHPPQPQQHNWPAAPPQTTTWPRQHRLLHSNQPLLTTNTNNNTNNTNNTTNTTNTTTSQVHGKHYCQA